MKITAYITTLFILLLSGSCATVKVDNAASLYENTWELEYISGPKIAFAGLYPDKKPIISFNKDSSSVQGNNSCNGYSAEYEMQSNQITFKDPGITTMMYCGEGEKTFLNTMKKITQYQIDSDGKLNLMMGEITLLRFNKK